MEALKIEGLSFTYPTSASPALKNIDLTVGSGELVLLCGGTGCGKTTLLRLIKNSIAPHGKREGEIFVFGKNISGMDIRTEAETVGMVMQRPESQIVSEILLMSSRSVLRACRSRLR